MDRRNEMLSLSEELFLPCLENKLKKLVKDNEQNVILNTEYSEVIAQFIQQAKQKQRDGLLGIVEYFSISYLYCSAITQTYEFKLSLMNQRLFLDEEAHTAYWSPTLIFDTIDNDMQMYMTEARKKWVRIRPFEFDDVRRAYVEKYNWMAGMFFAGKTLDAALKAGIEELEREQELKFLFGSHMDRQILFSTLRKAAVS